MKTANLFISSLAAILTAVGLTGCSKSAGDQPAEAPDKAEVKAGVMIDAATQERIGLKTEFPTATQWQPEIKGYGMVIDPAMLAAAVADLESARTAAEASGNEYTRLKSLAEQNNVSARALDAAKAASTHDELAFTSALAKFKLDWGSTLAADGGKILPEVINGTAALVRVDLPAGETLPAPPASVRIVALTDETKSVTGEFAGATDGVNPQTQSQSFFFSAKGRPIAPGAAVTGYLETSGEPLNGVVVPASAVLRHEGKGWIYVQTETNQFVRTEIPLDRLTDNGWFVSETLSATNRIVVTGAQTVLSAELGGGGSNAAARD